jgi:hypothetical protein
MPLHPSRKEELRQLLAFRDKINEDRLLGLRLEISQPPGVIDFSQLVVKFVGLTTLVVSGGSYTKTRDPISLSMTIPSGHASQTKVKTAFLRPVPFHPHVYTSGEICWGNVSNADSSSWTLVMWIMAAIEYLQLNQDSFIGINPHSPANPIANGWWRSNRGSISREVPQIDLAKLRQISYSVR